jgi:hypothetical protein
MTTHGVTRRAVPLTGAARSPIPIGASHARRSRASRASRASASRRFWRRVCSPSAPATGAAGRPIQICPVGAARRGLPGQAALRGERVLRQRLLPADRVLVNDATARFARAGVATPSIASPGFRALGARIVRRHQEACDLRARVAQKAEVRVTDLSRRMIVPLAARQDLAIDDDAHQPSA